MTAAVGSARSFGSVGPARLLRIELRRNTMIWMLPLLAVAFWFDCYRWVSTDAPVWYPRAAELLDHELRDFSALTAGVAAWMATRDSRRRILDMVTSTPRPGWARLGATWAATTGWVLAAYLACVAVVYGVTAAQVTWGGPPWWPAAVCAVALVAVSAVGFAAGLFCPSRFTAPLVAILTLLLSSAIRSTSPYAMLWPTTNASPGNTGGLPVAPADAGVFYHVLPDLPIAQIMFLGGIGLAALGVMGLSRPAAGGRWLRGAAAAVTVAGLAAAGTAAGLTGTARQGAYGVVIPALDDAASDQPIPYTPVCEVDGNVPVCLHPAYRAYLGVVAAAAAPLLREMAGLPGAPVRVAEIPSDILTATDDTNSTAWWAAGSAISGTPPVFRFPMPQFPAGPTGLTQLTEDVQEILAVTFVNDERLIPPGTDPGYGVQAQAAVELVLLQPFDPQAGQDVGIMTPNSAGPSLAVTAAARRFAALPAAARHAWLADHLGALRAGRVTLAELP
jgi:hypothetical protein